MNHRRMRLFKSLMGTGMVLVALAVASGLVLALFAITDM